MLQKHTIYLILTLSLYFLSGCASNPTESHMLAHDTEGKKAIYLEVPTTDCEIRKWYNYQVVAIPVINKRWIAHQISLEERAKQAFEIRHKARMNARFMMEDKEEVKKLRERDQKKYGNPNGPTFDFLVKKGQEKGIKGKEIYKQIIQSSSRTSPMYNALCEKKK